MADLLVKIFSLRSAFASHRHARGLAAGLPRQDHIYITTDKSFHFHINKLDEVPCNVDSTEIGKYPTSP